MKLIRAGVADLELLAPMFDAYRQFYSQPSNIDQSRRFLEQRLDKGESVVFMAVDDAGDRGLGFVQLYPSFSSVSALPTWILHDLFVVPDQRRQGVAQALMEAARSLAAKTGADGLSLSTATDNFGAQSLYESLGYRRDEKFIYYFLPLDHPP